MSAFTPDFARFFLTTEDIMQSAFDYDSSSKRGCSFGISLLVVIVLVAVGNCSG